MVDPDPELSDCRLVCDECFDGWGKPMLERPFGIRKISMLGMAMNIVGESPR